MLSMANAYQTYSLILHLSLILILKFRTVIALVAVEVEAVQKSLGRIFHIGF